MRDARRLLIAAALLVMAAVPSNTAAQAPARTVSTMDLATLRDIDPASVSPDGRWAAFVLRQADPIANDYEQDWMILSLESGEVRRLATAGTPILLGYLGLMNGSISPLKAAWSPDSHSILYQRKVDGRIELWRSAIASGESVRVGAFAGDIESLQPDLSGETATVRVGPDPQALAEALERDGRSGFLLDERIFPKYSTQPVLPASNTMDRALGRMTAAEYDAQRQDFTVDLRTFAIAPAEASEDGSPLAANTREPRVDGRGGRRAWFEARDPRYQGARPPITLVAALGPNDTPVACEHAQCTGILFPALFWRDDEVLFVRREGAGFTTNVLYAWNIPDQSVRTIFSTDIGFSDWVCGQTSDELICRYEELLRPARLVGINLATGDRRTLFDPNPQFEELAASYTVSRVDADFSDGGTTHGFLVKRADLADQALPLVVATYRCSGFLRGGTGDEYPILPLASEGFAALCHHLPDTDYDRLATLGWGAYQLENRQSNREKVRVQLGLDAMVNQLVQQGDADPGRIAVTGLSFGAETTNYALFNAPYLTAAIASSAAIAPSNIFLSGASWRAYELWGLSDPHTQIWRDLSVVHNARRVRAPMLLNLADREMIGALEVYWALDREGRAIEAFVYPDEYHIKWQPVHRLAVYNRNIDWLSFWLRGGEEGRTGDMDQYVRWRTMRNAQCRLFGPGGSDRHARPRGHEALSDEALIPWYCSV